MTKDDPIYYCANCQEVLDDPFRYKSESYEMMCGGEYMRMFVLMATSHTSHPRNPDQPTIEKYRMIKTHPVLFDSKDGKILDFGIHGQFFQTWRQLAERREFRGFCPKCYHDVDACTCKTEWWKKYTR